MSTECAAMRKASAKRTLLIVAPYFFPVVGGLEQYVLRLANELHRRGHWRVVIATSGNRGRANACETFNGITVYRLGYSWRLSNTPLGLQWPHQMRLIIEQEKPDLINAHVPVPGLADVAAYVGRDIPLITTYHTTSMHKGNIRYDIPIWVYERLIRHHLLAKSDRIICASSAVVEFLNSYSVKCAVIQPAVDTNLFTPGSSRAGRRLLFVGNLARSHSHKGLSFLLEALARPRCQHFYLDVVGDGNARSGYEAQCRRLGISDRVRFLGRLDGPALIGRYRKSYALVQPSTNDNLPNAILEAMACGLPVIASRIGGISSIIRCGINGDLVTPGDAGELAVAIEKLFSDPAKAADYGRVARMQVAAAFGIEQQADRTEKVFKEVMENFGGKVAVVTPYYHPQTGGLENYARQFVRIMLKAGLPVVVFTSHDGRHRVVDEVDGVKVYRLPRLFKLLNTPFHPLWPLWLRSLFARERIKVINAHTPVPVMADAARLARNGHPFIVTYHNDLIKDSRLGQLLCRLEYYLFTKPTLAAADRVVATSEHYARHSPRLRGLQGKITICSPGVDTAVFRRPDAGKTIPVRFVFVAQLDRTHRHKGLDRLLEAVALAKRTVPGLSLTVVGRGNDKQRYISRVRAMGLADSVKFVGYVSNEVLRDTYSSACAVVLPAEHDGEGFGMVILEAAACRVPAVATRVGGIPAAVLDGETGLLVPSGDTASLAAALVRLAQDTKLREYLAAQAYNRVMQTFSWEAQSRALLSIIQIAMSDRNGLRMLRDSGDMTSRALTGGT